MTLLVERTTARINRINAAGNAQFNGVFNGEFNILTLRSTFWTDARCAYFGFFKLFSALRTFEFLPSFVNFLNR